MRWYRDDKDAWKEIIEAIASEEHRTALMVEKDTIQSMFLMGLSLREHSIVFKGGTSLSKAYDLINRFSEDIDLSMSRKPTEFEKKHIKITVIEVAEDIGLTLVNPENIRSRYNYNKYVFEYDSLFSEILQEIIIETSFYQAAYPVENRAVCSFIGRFCEKKGIKLPILFEADTVNMQVQSLERTFIDKVFAVCDYWIRNMQDRDSRHLYDIAKLLPEIEITKEMGNLVTEVRKDRMQSKNNPSAQPEYNIPDMLKKIISSRFYELDYNNITKKLLYEDVTYEEAVNNGIGKVAELDIFEYREQE